MDKITEKLDELENESKVDLYNMGLSLLRKKDAEALIKIARAALDLIEYDKIFPGDDAIQEHLIMPLKELGDL